MPNCGSIRNSAAARGEYDERQQMVGDVFRAGPRGFDDLGQQQQEQGERQQHVAERDGPRLQRGQRHGDDRLLQPLEPPPIRKTTMLTTASGIRSSGKPIIDIGGPYLKTSRIA